MSFTPPAFGTPIPPPGPLGAPTGTFAPPHQMPASAPVQPPAPASAPTMPQQPVAAPAPAAAPETRALTLPEMEAQLFPLIKQRCTYQGKPVIDGDATYATKVVEFVKSTAPAVVAEGEPRTRAIYNWLMALTAPFELDPAARQAVQQAPASVISDQKVAQLGAPPPPAEPPKGEEKDDEPEVDEQLVDPVDGTTYKKLRGFKTHVTRTHKSDWGVFCNTHGLDPKTGRKVGAPAPTPISTTPTTPPPSNPAIAPMYGTQPAAPAPQAVPAATPAPQAAPAAQGVPVASFHPSAPQTAPAQQQVAFNPAAGFQPQQPAAPAPQQPAPQTMPTPPAQHQAPPAQQPVMGFVPVTTPAPQAAPAQQPAPAQSLMQAPAPVPPPQAAPGHVPAGMNREQIARMLGGGVQLIILKLTDAATINLENRIDVNQLAMLAEQQAKAELHIMDLAQGQYGAGKQAATRHFADLLGKYRDVYLLLNGFDPIIPAGYFEIVMSRTIKAYLVTDQGRGFVELKLG